MIFALAIHKYVAVLWFCFWGFLLFLYFKPHQECAKTLEVTVLEVCFIKIGVI